MRAAARRSDRPGTAALQIRGSDGPRSRYSRLRGCYSDDALHQAPGFPSSSRLAPKCTLPCTQRSQCPARSRRWFPACGPPRQDRPQSPSMSQLWNSRWRRECQSSHIEKFAARTPIFTAQPTDQPSDRGLGLRRGDWGYWLPRPAPTQLAAGPLGRVSLRRDRAGTSVSAHPPLKWERFPSPGEQDLADLKLPSTVLECLGESVDLVARRPLGTGERAPGTGEFPLKFRLWTLSWGADHIRWPLGFRLSSISELALGLLHLRAHDFRHYRPILTFATIRPVELGCSIASPERAGHSFDSISVGATEPRARQPPAIPSSVTLIAAACLPFTREPRRSRGRRCDEDYSFDLKRNMYPPTCVFTTGGSASTGRRSKWSR